MIMTVVDETGNMMVGAQGFAPLLPVNETLYEAAVASAVASGAASVASSGTNAPP